MNAILRPPVKPGQAIPVKKGNPKPKTYEEAMESRARLKELGKQYQTDARTAQTLLEDARKDIERLQDELNQERLANQAALDALQSENAELQAEVAALRAGGNGNSTGMGQIEEAVEAGLAIIYTAAADMAQALKEGRYDDAMVATEGQSDDSEEDADDEDDDTIVDDENNGTNNFDMSAVNFDDDDDDDLPELHEEGEDQLAAEDVPVYGEDDDVVVFGEEEDDEVLAPRGEDDFADAAIENGSADLTPGEALDNLLTTDNLIGLITTSAATLDSLWYDGLAPFVKDALITKNTRQIVREAVKMVGDVSTFSEEEAAHAQAFVQNLEAADFNKVLTAIMQANGDALGNVRADDEAIPALTVPADAIEG
jgi:hypothetical protein